MRNRRWVLAKRPQAALSADCFRLEECDREGPGNGEGQVLVRNELLLCAPTIRNWLSGNRNSYYPTIEIGEPVLAPSLSRVILSHDPGIKVGTRLIGTGSWQDEEWVNPARYRQIPDSITSIDAMGIFGLNALTAYCGLLEIGKPKNSEVLLVSGASGSVGSVVSQIGRIKGCKVIGLCGGSDKVRWLREQCGIEHVIDYKSEDVTARIDAISPDGIDIYFDNVGGPLLADIAGRMRRFGRIVLCGQIATYDDGGDMLGPPLDMMRMIYGGIRMQGFLASHHSGSFPEAMTQLARWHAEGLIAHREDVRDGLNNLPETFLSLFSGSNQGTLLARIADADGGPI